MKASEAHTISVDNPADIYRLNEILLQIIQEAKKGMYYITVKDVVVYNSDRSITTVGQRLVELGYTISKFPYTSVPMARTHKIISWKNPTK